MKNDLQAGLQNIIDAINNLIEPKLGSLRYDKTFRAKVISDEGNNVYGVQINGKNYKAVYTGKKIAVGQIVRVKAPLNNFSDIYIETLPGSGSGEAGNYNSLLNKPILNTNNTSAQTPSATETILGTISLHKISKTGNYNDLLNKPTLDFIPTSEKGAANGVAGLDGNKRVSKSNLPTDTVYDNNYIHTDNNFTTAMKDKLDSVEEGAEPNKIETIQKNGTTLPINNKMVNVEVPTKTSDLTNDSGFISSIPIASSTKLGGIKVGNNLSITADGTLNASGGGTTDYSDLLNKPVLNTANSASLAVDGNETINGVISLHKISKTGSYEDLLNKPTIPTKTGDLTNNGDGTEGSKYITNSELNTGLNSKQNTITGGATTIVSDNLTVNRALVSNANGKVAVSNTTSTELGYLSGARSNLQGQIDAITTEGGQPNVIEVVQENGVPLEVTNKTVNVTVPTKVSEIENDSGYVTSSVSNLQNYYQKIDTYNQSQIDLLLNNKANTIDIPTKTSQLTNDSNFATTDEIIFGYDTVADMKAANLENGNIARTLGYYNKNDYGGAYYSITNEESLTADDSFVIALTNGLKAKLIYNEQINIRCLGARSQDEQNNKYDVAPYIQKFLNRIDDNRLCLYIPSGVWYCSPLEIQKTWGFSIVGDPQFTNYSCGGTIITSLNANQDYIFKIGNTSAYTGNFLLKGITFSSGDYQYFSADNNFRVPDTNTKTVGAALSFMYATFGLLDDINFTHVIGKCMSITSSWELRFSRLGVLNCSNVSGGLIVFETLDKTLTTDANISNIEIQQLNVEAINGNIIQCETGCRLIDTCINNFHFEPFTCGLENCTSHALNDGSFDYDTVIHWALIRCNGEASITINNIMLNNICYRYVTSGSTQYFYDSIISYFSSIKETICFIINNIMIQGMNRNLNLVYQPSAYAPYKNSIVEVGSISNHSSFNCIYNVENFPTIINKACLRNNSIAARSTFNNNFNAFSRYTRNRANDEDRRYLVYDTGVLNDDFLAVAPISNNVAIFCNCARYGSKIFIRAKIESGKTYQLILCSPSYTGATRISMAGTGDYKVYEADISSTASVFTDNPSAIMYSASDNDPVGVRLDYFYFV